MIQLAAINLMTRRRTHETVPADNLIAPMPLLLDAAVPGRLAFSACEHAGATGRLAAGRPLTA